MVIGWWLYHCRYVITVETLYWQLTETLIAIFFRVLKYLLLLSGWNTTAGICSRSCRTSSWHCSDQRWNGKLWSGYYFPWSCLSLSWISTQCLFWSFIFTYLGWMSPFLKAVDLLASHWAAFQVSIFFQFKMFKILQRIHENIHHLKIQITLNHQKKVPAPSPKDYHY